MSDNLSHPLTSEEAAQIIRDGNMGEPVGFRVLRDYSGPACADGCLAPGSSPHHHGTAVAYQLIGTTGYLELDATTLNGMRAGSIRPLSDLDQPDPAKVAAAKRTDQTLAA
jgi:hypothetical protein